MGKKVTIRYRWGVQHDGRARGGQRAYWLTLGAGWMIDRTEVEHLDVWPASFKTRARARQEAQAITARAKEHGLEWRFRVVKLELRTRECP